MKAEFKKTEHLFSKLNDMKQNEKKIRLPSIPELAFLGNRESVFLCHVFFLILGCLIGLLSLLFGITTGFMGFFLVSIFVYIFVVAPYCFYVQYQFDASSIKSHFLIEFKRKEILQSYEKALESLDIEYLNYDSFSRNETLILMDKARIEGLKSRSANHQNKDTLTSIKIINPEAVKNK